MNRWEFLHMGADSAERNMAFDRELLAEVADGRPPVCRFYRWQQPAFSFGYSQQIADVVDLEACERAGIELVQRPTGGGLVIHGWDFTYTLVAPVGGEVTSPLPKGLLASYRQIHTWVQQALAELGADVMLAPERRVEGVPASCLMNVAPYDLMLDGRKVGGGAQRRRRRTLLHQGYLALSLPPPNVLHLAGVHAPTVAIHDFYPAVDRDSLAESIQKVITCSPIGKPVSN